MRPTVTGSVELDVCVGCGSVFFDAGELRRHLGTGRRLEDELHKAAGAAGTPSDRSCPKCAGAFSVVNTLSGPVAVCGGCDGALLRRAAFLSAPSKGVLPAPVGSTLKTLQGGAGDAALFGAEVAVEVAVEAIDIAADPALLEGMLELAGSAVEFLVEGIGEILGGL